MENLELPIIRQFLGMIAQISAGGAIDFWREGDLELTHGCGAYSGTRNLLRRRRLRWVGRRAQLKCFVIAGIAGCGLGGDRVTEG